MSEFDEMFSKPSQKYPTLEELAKMVIPMIKTAGFNRNCMHNFDEYATGKLKDPSHHSFYNKESGKDTSEAILKEITRAKEDNSYDGEAFLNMSALLFNSFSSDVWTDKTHVFGLLNILNNKPFEDKKLEYDVLDTIEISSFYGGNNVNKAILIQKVKNPYAQKQDFIELARITENKDELLNIWRASNEHFDKLIRDESKKEYPNIDNLKLLYDQADNVQRFILETRAEQLFYGKPELKEFRDLLAEFGEKYDFARIQEEQIPTHLDDFQKQIGEENSALKNDKAKAEEDLKTEQAKNEKLNDDYNKAQTEISDLKQRNQDLTDDKTKLQDEINKLKEQLQNKQKELDSMTTQRDLYKIPAEKFDEIHKYVQNSNFVLKQKLNEIINKENTQGK